MLGLQRQDKGIINLLIAATIAAVMQCKQLFFSVVFVLQKKTYVS